MDNNQRSLEYIIESEDIILRFVTGQFTGCFQIYFLIITDDCSIFFFVLSHLCVLLLAAKTRRCLVSCVNK